MSLSALNLNRCLTIVLALVIALQSLVAIGDASQIHHPETIHQSHAHVNAPVDESEHDHDEAVVDVVNMAATDTEPSSTSHSSSDHASNHCHQNHAHSHMMLVSAVLNITALSAGQRLSDYQASHTSVTQPSLFRPPIV